MMITKSKFTELLNQPNNRKYNIIFLGMSGSGKTYWSKLLSRKYGLIFVEFDELIGNSNELKSLIMDFPGKDEAEKLGNYFGMPWNEDYQDKENQFLAVERKFLSQKFPPGNILDITGSAVYHPKLIDELAKTGFMIYLETSEEAQQEMLDIYINNPKPICWNGIFKKNDEESNEEALKRCFPLLLKYRAGLYDKYADIKIPYEIHKNIHETEKFVEEVCNRLGEVE